MEEDKNGAEDMGPVEPKHTKLAEQENEGFSLMENKFTKNDANPFIHHSRSWEDEEMKIPEEI